MSEPLLSGLAKKGMGSVCCLNVYHNDNESEGFCVARLQHYNDRKLHELKMFLLVEVPIIIMVMRQLFNRLIHCFLEARLNKLNKLLP